MLFLANKINMIIKNHWDFHMHFIESLDSFGSTDIFHFMSNVCVFSQLFSIFQVYSFLSFLRVIQKHFIVSNIITNVLFISFSVHSLLVSRNPNYFCVFILYTANLPVTSTGSSVMELLGFSM